MKFLRKLISPKVLIAVAIALVVGHFIDPSIAFAVGAGDDNETLKAFAQLFSVFVNIFTFLSLVFLNYGGDLVGTEFLTTPEPMETIRPMWVIIRNITNVGFVLVLLFLAFSNLFSSFGEGGNWTIKEKLPKVILALIAINFSLLGFKLVIDAVHVGTITIFSIPDSTLQTKGKGQLEDMLRADVAVDKDSVTSYVAFYEVMNDLMCGEGWKGAEYTLPDQEGTFWKVKNPLPPDCLFAIDPADMKVGQGANKRSQSAHNLFLAFGIQFQKLQNLPSLAARLNDWSDVFTSVLFVSILSLAQVIALAAVFIALLLRMVVLWVAMVFSPLLIAGAVMGFGGGGEGKIGQQVITNLIMPLKIAAAFAVSFLMMDTMISVGGPSGDFIKTGMSVSTFGSTGYGLLWSIATIVVFWKAAFWALEGSAGEEIANKIKGGAESAGGFLARAGTIDREFFPMPGMDGNNKVALSSLWKATTSGVVTAHDKAMQKDARSVTDHLNLTDAEKTGSIEKVNDALEAKVGTMDNEGLIKFLEKYGLSAFREQKDLSQKLYGKLDALTKEKYGSEESFVKGMYSSSRSDQDTYLTGISSEHSTRIKDIEEDGTTTASKKESENYVNVDTEDKKVITIGGNKIKLESGNYDEIITKLKEDEKAVDKISSTDYTALVKLFAEWEKKYTTTVDGKEEEKLYKVDEMDIGRAALKKEINPEK